MEHTQQLLKELKNLRNQSVHQGGFDIILSPQNILIYVVYERLNFTGNFSSPLVQQFISSVENGVFLPYIELEKVGKYLPLKVRDLSDEEFFNISQGLIEECLKEFGRGYNVYTPTKLNEILADLINPSPNQIIYDPACGIGSTFVEIHNRFPNLNLKFIGQEIDGLIYLLCQINLLINGVENAEIFCANSINEPLDEYKNKVDFAVSELPNNVGLLGVESEISRFIDIMLSMIGKEGKAIAIVRDYYLFSTVYEKIRKEYLDGDLIEQVISLPDNLYKPYSVRKASILVFNKNKKLKGKLIFDGIDFRNESKFEKTEVGTEAIIQTDLRANRYALQSRKDVEFLFKTTSYPVIKINDIVSFSKVGRPYTINSSEDDKTLESLPFIRRIDLSKENENSSINVSKLERTRPKLQGYNLVDFQAVLCSLVGGKLKPTIFNYDETPVIISQDIIALQLNEKINVDYFLIQLKSDYVRAQLESISDTPIYRIRKADFLNIKIILPPLSEQSRQAIESLKAKQKELREDIFEEKKEAKLAEYDIIRITVHDLNHKLGAMQNDLNALKKFFEENLSDYLQKPIKPIFDDDSEEDINQLRLINVLHRLINTRNEASAQLAATREELQNNTVRPVRGNFKKWLEKEIKPLHEDKIDFIVEGENIDFDFDSNRFQNLVRNFTENAVQHNAKKVVFDLSYVYLGGKKQNKESVRILYKNDGDRFPDDFDFNSHFKGLYQKSSKSTGTGIGGYSINRTIELHNGEMTNVSPEKETFDLYPVQIEIVLPIEHKSNQNYVKSNPYTTD